MESRTRIKENSELHPARQSRPITHVSLKELGEDLQLSLKGFLPRTSAPYKKVRCLLIAWAHAYEQDEGGVRQDFDEFRDLMLEHYHFEVDEYLVDRTKDQTMIEWETVVKCTQFGPQRDELLILYYAGHSYYQEWSRRTIFSSNRINDPDRRWRREIDFHQRIAENLNLTPGDVLYVIDACYSRSIAVENSRETLAASAIEMMSDARTNDLQSFTQAFCQTIRADPRPATVAQIHARLVSQWQDLDNGNNLQTTPVHKAAASFDRPSIILAPPNGPSATLKSGKPQVIISATLDDEIPVNLAEWRNWLRRKIPTNVAEIDVEGVFKTTSYLVLLRLPVALWDMLPDHDAYSFVGYAQSSNVLVTAPSAKKTSSRPLPITLRDPKEKEKEFPHLQLRM